MVTGAASTGSASSLWNPWIKENRYFFALILSVFVALQCVINTQRNIFFLHEALVSSAAIHAHNTVNASA